MIVNRIVNRRRIASSALFAVLTAVQIVALTRPATAACPVRFRIDAAEKITTRTVETKVRAVRSETAPAVRGKLISIAQRSTPHLTAAARRKATAVAVAAASRKNSEQH